MHDVRIEDRPAHRVVGMPHAGAYDQIGRAFEQVFALLGARGAQETERGMIAVYYDDPGTTPTAELRSFAGAMADGEFEPDPPLLAVDLPAGRYAVLTFRGPYSGLQGAYDHLYGEWLPNSGESPADSPVFESYLNSPQTTAPDALLTEICLPLA